MRLSLLANKLPPYRSGERDKRGRARGRKRERGRGGYAVVLGGKTRAIVSFKVQEVARTPIGH